MTGVGGVVAQAGLDPKFAVYSGVLTRCIYLNKFVLKKVNIITPFESAEDDESNGVIKSAFQFSAYSYSMPFFSNTEYDHMV